MLRKNRKKIRRFFSLYISDTETSSDTEKSSVLPSKKRIKPMLRVKEKSEFRLIPYISITETLLRY